jgi:tetratricopeptide (TPR) repeat protein
MSRTRHLPLALLLLAVLASYANSFENSFHFDDFHTIVENPAIRSLHNVPRFFTDASTFSVLPSNRTWRPVVSTSLAVDYALARGYGVRWFHASTMLWFLLLLVVLDRFFELLLDRVQTSRANPWLALGIAAWFGLHPAMAETVNYVIQRGDLYCTLGCVTALYVFARWPCLRRTGLYLLPFALAMLSKPPAVVFPLLLLLYTYFFDIERNEDSPRWKRAFAATWPAFVAAAAMLALSSAMTPRSYTPTDLPAWTYRITQPYVWLRYTGQLFLPLHLNADTDLRRFTSMTPLALAGLLYALALLAAFVACARRRRLYPIAFGLAWFVLTQLPTSLYALSEVENDHRMFFSFPGLMLAVVWTLYLAHRSLATKIATNARFALRWTTVVCALLLLAGYAYGAHRRNAVWRSEETLWADDVAKCPRNGRGLMMYGTSLLNRGEPGPALVYFQRALQFTPNYADLELNLGVASGALADEGDRSLANAAEQHFERALMLAPTDDRAHAFYARWLLAHGRLDEATAQAATAVKLNPARPMNCDLLLRTEIAQGRYDDARTLARETLRAMPGDAEALLALQPVANLDRTRRDALINLSLAAYTSGRWGESAQLARAALVLDPHAALAWNNLGAAEGSMGDFANAIAAEQHALAENPTLAIARNNLAAFEAHREPTQTERISPAAPLITQSLALYRAGRFAQSLNAARLAIAIDQNSAEAWNNAAADEAALHHWDAAIAAAEKAIALKPDLAIAHNNLAWALQHRAAAKK